MVAEVGAWLCRKIHFDINRGIGQQTGNGPSVPGEE
jgi:hypothetical protein